MKRAAALMLAAACAAHAQLAELVLRADPAAELAVDGAPAGKVSDYPRSTVRLRPGTHRIELRSNGLVESREVELGPGDSVALTIGPEGSR